MARLRVWWSVLAMATALGWSVAIASPAAADPPKVVTAAYDGSLCGVVVVTVTNPLETSAAYVLDAAEPAQFGFSVKAKGARVNHVAVSDGDTVKFRGIGATATDVEASEFRYDAPKGCTTGRLVVGIQRACTNLLITLTNRGPTETADVLMVVRDQVIIPAAKLRPDEVATALFAPSGGEVGPFTFTVRQRAADGTFFDMLVEEDIFLSSCLGKTVDVTNTCTGVHVTTRTGPGDTLIVEAATGRPKRQEFDVETDPDEFDVDVASGSLLAIGFPHDEFARGIGTTFDVAAFHRHVAVCPTAPAGGGGGLPVTGTRPLAAAGAGAGLLLLGAAAVLLLRRRRTTFSA